MSRLATLTRLGQLTGGQEYLFVLRAIVQDQIPPQLLETARKGLSKLIKSVCAQNNLRYWAQRRDLKCLAKFFLQCQRMLDQSAQIDYSGNSKSAFTLVSSKQSLDYDQQDKISLQPSSMVQKDANFHIGIKETNRHHKYKPSHKSWSLKEEKRLLEYMKKNWEHIKDCESRRKFKIYKKMSCYFSRRTLNDCKSHLQYLIQLQTVNKSENMMEELSWRIRKMETDEDSSEENVCKFELFVQINVDALSSW